VTVFIDPDDVVGLADFSPVDANLERAVEVFFSPGMVGVLPMTR
jgi:hypothetical protein